jgi:hypothetical protein
MMIYKDDCVNFVFVYIINECIYVLSRYSYGRVSKKYLHLLNNF